VPRGTRVGSRCQAGSMHRPLVGGPTSPHDRGCWQVGPPYPREHSAVHYLPSAPTCSPFAIFPPVPFLPVAFPTSSPPCCFRSVPPLTPLCSPPSLTLPSSRSGPCSCPSCGHHAHPCYSRSNFYNASFLFVSLLL
jgi:hypothetical protein